MSTAPKLAPEWNNPPILGGHMKHFTGCFQVLVESRSGSIRNFRKDMHPEPRTQTFFALIIVLTEIFGTLAGFQLESSLFGGAMLLIALGRQNWSFKEVRVLALSFVVGGAWEGLAVHQEWIIYKGTQGFHSLPWWMLISWMAFAMLLRSGLRTLSEHPFRALLIGLCAGPLFVMTAEQMGLLAIPHAEVDLKWIGMGWGASFALMALIARPDQMEGIRG